MTVALLAVALVQPISLFVVCRYLTRRDERERSERADLLQRIQAPEAAVVAHIQTAEAPPVRGPAHLPFDDDDAWRGYMSEAAQR